MSRKASRSTPQGASPFAPVATPLTPGKFADPLRTADGSERALVPLVGLETLWFNTGTLCNLSCAGCYIESSPTNDALVYLKARDVVRFLNEIEAKALSTREIGFTGGEPFMNPNIIEILDVALSHHFDILVLTNAMKPMRRHEAALLSLRERHGARLTLRVSLDHHTAAIHEAERGPGTWAAALDGLGWLTQHGFSLAVAGRLLPHESEDEARNGYAALFARLGLPLDAADPARLVLFPEMDAMADIAEITTDCWRILDKQPSQVMCATSRMVVHRKGEPAPRVAACTLIPYDPQFDLGASLSEASAPVRLNHPHCARFCVLGGASCSA
jgi:uncharacterized Fe-S cluster-containing radical SAM superfamily protein